MLNVWYLELFYIMPDLALSPTQLALHLPCLDFRRKTSNTPSRQVPVLIMVMRKLTEDVRQLLIKKQQAKSKKAKVIEPPPKSPITEESKSSSPEGRESESENSQKAPTTKVLIPRIIFIERCAKSKVVYTRTKGIVRVLLSSPSDGRVCRRHRQDPQCE